MKRRQHRQKSSFMHNEDEKKGTNLKRIIKTAVVWKWIPTVPLTISGKMVAWKKWKRNQKITLPSTKPNQSQLHKNDDDDGRKIINEKIYAFKEIYISTCIQFINIHFCFMLIQLNVFCTSNHDKYKL